uniref:Uncharacterized protein n=1 Tax=Arundo donax TaxID=35708 RepID=A0A0A9GYV8_ARUDO
MAYECPSVSLMGRFSPRRY